MIVKSIFRVFSIMLFLLPATQSAMGAMVLVGGYEFAPFVEIDSDGRPYGWTPDLIDALNQSQSEHEFIFVHTSPSRRYQDYNNGVFDVIFFEDTDWGWRQRDILLEKSPVILEGGEVYLALSGNGRGQEYFDRFEGKRLVGVLGYHYGLADFNADPDYLRQKFGMTLVESNKAIIQMILKGRADMGVITLAYLEQYLALNPSNRDKLIISDKYDQKGSYRVLARPGFNPSAAQIFHMLEDLEAEGLSGRGVLHPGVPDNHDQ